MAKKEVNKTVAEKLRSENVILAKFQKGKEMEDRFEKWSVVDDAVSAARRAYLGKFEGENTSEEKVSFDKAIGDLIEVLVKIQKGEIKSLRPEKIEKSFVLEI